MRGQSHRQCQYLNINITITIKVSDVNMNNKKPINSTEQYVNLDNMLYNRTNKNINIPTSGSYIKYRRREVVNISPDKKISKPITYKINSDGFRSNEITTDKDCLLFLGGADTIGIGVSQDNIFSNIVSAHYNLECINLGTRQTSYDTIFRLLYMWGNKLKDNIKGVVIVLHPEDVYNLELIPSNNEPVICTPREMSTNDVFLNSWKHTIPEHQQQQTEEFLLSIKKFTESLEVPLVIINLREENLIKDYSRAVRTKTIGIQSHKAVANKIIGKLGNLNNFHQPHIYNSFNKHLCQRHQHYVVAPYDNFKISEELEFLEDKEKEKYEYNLKHNKDKLKQQGWFNKKITYTLNSIGFRCNDVREMNSDDILCLGCSFTFGEGLNVENTWPYKLNKLTGVRTWNLGVQGASLDLCFRLAYQWVNLKKPKYLCILLPELGRREVLSKDRFIHPGIWGNWTITSENLNNRSWYVKWIFKNENAVLHRYKTLLALQKLCDDNNTTLIYNSIAEFDKQGSLARDLSHPGIVYNDNVANVFHEKIKSYK